MCADSVQGVYTYIERIEGLLALHIHARKHIQVYTYVYRYTQNSLERRLNNKKPQ